MCPGSGNRVMISQEIHESGIIRHFMPLSERPAAFCIEQVV